MDNQENIPNRESGQAIETCANLEGCFSNFTVNSSYNLVEIEEAFNGILLEKGTLFEQGYLIADSNLDIIVTANWRGGKLVATLALNKPWVKKSHGVGVINRHSFLGNSRDNIKIDGSMLDSRKHTHLVKLVVPTLKRLVFLDNISNGAGEQIQRTAVHRSVEANFIAAIRKVKVTTGLLVVGDEVAGVDALIQDMLQLSHDFRVSAGDRSRDVGQSEPIANCIGINVFDGKGVLFVGSPKCCDSGINIIDFVVD